MCTYKGLIMKNTYHFLQGAKPAFGEIAAGRAQQRHMWESYPGFAGAMGSKYLPAP